MPNGAGTQRRDNDDDSGDNRNIRTSPTHVINVDVYVSRRVWVYTTDQKCSITYRKSLL